MAINGPLAGNGRRTLLEELTGNAFVPTSFTASSILSAEQRGGHMGAAIERGKGTIGQQKPLGTTIQDLQKQRQKGILAL